MAAKLWK